jgi:hypothetical protein
MQPIESITPADFLRNVRLEVSYGNTKESFVLTGIGRINYAVSIEFGYAYTRPQLIAKYRNVAATFEATPMKR